MSNWTLFSNHGHVLLFVSQQPEARLRDIADRVGITERAVQKIVRDLQDGGLLSVTKHGRCNHYRIHGRKNLRHALEAHCTVSQLVDLIHPEGAISPATTAATPAPAVTTVLKQVGSGLPGRAQLAPPAPVAVKAVVAPAATRPPVERKPPVEARPAPGTRAAPKAAPKAKGRGRKRGGDDSDQGSLF